MSSAEADADGELPLATALYRVVRDNIQSGRLPAGTPLNAHRLGQQLSVSRAPIGRALQQLELDGLIVRNPARGYRVRGAISQPPRQMPQLELSDETTEIVRGRAGWEKIWDTVERDLVACMPFGRFKVVELAMAEYYGVSRTVTSELIARFEARGLLEKAGRSQCFLRELTSALMDNLYEVRRLLEPTALLASADQIARHHLEQMREDLREAERRYPDVLVGDLTRYEDDLHVVCTRPCANQPLLAALRQSQLPVLATNRLFQIYLGMPALEPFLAEHRLVIELLLNSAPDAAALALDAHLRSAVRKQHTRLKELKAKHQPVVPPYLYGGERG